MSPKESPFARPAPAWLRSIVERTAREIADAGNTIRRFDRVIAGKLDEAPFTDWELARWTRGLGRGLILMNPPLFRLGSGKFSSYHFFVRNEAGLLVGLRRESFTQAAAYVSLVTDYGHARGRVRFETEFLDVAVRDAEGRLALYAEAKAADKTLRKLVDALAAGFTEGLPPVREGETPSDPWQKAGHILRARPRHFWAVSPGLRLAFAVDYAGHGFRLRPLDDLPTAFDVSKKTGDLRQGDWLAAAPAPAGDARAAAAERRASRRSREVSYARP